MDIQELIKKNPLDGIESYNTKLSISNVIKFFERQNIYFTKTMIQNYVRINALPELENKRWYQKKHIAVLFLIDSLKEIYSLDELKILLNPLFNKDENFDFKIYLEVFVNNYNETILNSLNEIEIFEEEKNLIENLILSSKSKGLKDLSIKN